MARQMIYDSAIWKEQLLRRADKLAKWQKQRRWPSRSLGLMEQELMLGFFSIRRLVESHKVSDEIVDDPVRVSRAPSTGYGASRINAHKIEQLFDFAKVSAADEKLNVVCNQVIHSFAFTFLMDEDDRGESFIVASDWRKDDHGMIIGLATAEALFRRVGENHPASIQMRRGADGQFRVSVGPGDGTVPDRDVDALARDLGV